MRTTRFWNNVHQVQQNEIQKIDGLLWFMGFNATFNNISFTSWRPVLLVDETGVLRENHWPVASHWQTLSHNVVEENTSPGTGFELKTSVVIGTDCTGSCKFNYHTITTTTTPQKIESQNNLTIFWSNTINEIKQDS